jgi:hypothetical protein
MSRQLLHPQFNQFTSHTGNYNTDEILDGESLAISNGTLTGGASTTRREMISIGNTTFSNLGVLINSNLADGDTEFRVNIDNVDSAVKVTIPATITGKFFNTVDTVTATNGQRCQIRFNQLSAVGQVEVASTTTTIDSRAKVNYFNTYQVNNTASTVTYFSINSRTAHTTTEANAEVNVMRYDLLRNFTIYIRNNLNSGGQDCIYTFRKNATDGNQTITVGGGLTGNFIDAVNQDWIKPDDAITIKSDNSAGSSTLATVSTQFESVKKQSQYLYSDTGSWTATSEEYGGLRGLCNWTTNTDNQATLVGINCKPAGTIIEITSNTSTDGTSNFTLLDDLSQILPSNVIGTGLSGIFKSTTTNDNQIAAQSQLQWRASQAVNGTVTFSSLGVVLKRSFD